VFSNHFLVLQAKRMVHAETLEGERAARFILMNECGVGLDPRTGSAEGRSFRTANAHLNWLRELGAELGLDPARLGRWESGSAATRAFLEGLDRTYGCPDGRVGAAASFAVETWAAHGIGGGPEAEAGNFWRELIDGLEGHNRRVRAPAGLPPLPLKFFRYHFELEAGHGAGVWAELEAEARRPDFDPELFLRTGKDALDAVLVFWTGLAEVRGRSGQRPDDEAEQASAQPAGAMPGRGEPQRAQSRGQRPSRASRVGRTSMWERREPPRARPWALTPGPRA
jgi:hypothetical protein